MAEAGHSHYSASGFEAAMLCPGKPVMESGKPNNSNIYSATGTAAHQILEWCLKDDREPAAFLGRLLPVEGFDIEVDEDMVEALVTAIRNIRDIVGDGLLLTEQRVNYAAYLGVEEAEAWGTADIIGARGDELQVHDYKNGSGVAVSPERNPQMMLYGLGTLATVNDVLGPFKTVRLVIHQPNIKDAPSEWVCTVEELEAWGRLEARNAVIARLSAASSPKLTQHDWNLVYLRPGEKQCKFCKAKATCPSLRNEVTQTVAVSTPASPDEFAEMVVPGKEHIGPTDGEWLAAALSKVDLIEDWCKAVRADVERRLLAAVPVPGYKLVQGKMGNRKWADAAEAEAALKAMRVKVEQMYDMKLISPTSAEKLHKAEVIGKRQWPKLQGLITQTRGKPHVALQSDPRAALELAPVADEFETVSQPNAELA